MKSSKKFRIIDLINWADVYFKAKKFENPRIEIEWLIKSVLKINRIDIYLKFDHILSDQELKTLKSFIQRRLKREPLQYITNSCEFYGLEYFINENVLIPRPETEMIIDIAEKALINKKTPKVLDIGTGSGCIGITLASRNKDYDILGIDISDKALDVANRNKDNLSNITFIKMDILNQTPKGKYDIIISNPPYIPLRDFPKVTKDVKGYEPMIALTDQADGLTFYRRYMNIVDNILKDDGKILLEVGLNQHPFEVKKILIEKGMSNIKLIKDLNGDNRFILA